MTVNLYRDEFEEVVLLCEKCAKEYPSQLEVIDKAATWDECEICSDQNTPAHWTGEEFPFGEFDNGYHWNQEVVYE